MKRDNIAAQSCACVSYLPIDMSIGPMSSSLQLKQTSVLGLSPGGVSIVLLQLIFSWSCSDHAREARGNIMAFSLLLDMRFGFCLSSANYRRLISPPTGATL